MAFVTPSVSIARPRAHQRPWRPRRTLFIAPCIRHRARLQRAPPLSMAISSNDFRPGVTIELDGVPYKVVEFLHVKPGKGAAFVRTKLKNMTTGNNIDKTFKAGEMVEKANMEKVAMQHTYVDGDYYVFMNLETFDEERLSPHQLGDNVVKFMMEGLDVQVLKHGDNVIGVEIPKTIPFEVVRTDPGVKGNTVQGATKPAVIETGAEIMVPLFIKEGERINVNTEDGKYVGRSNE
ncbi:Elongation factor P [Gracilariopsis chorda]|uniref:Elongation factor P n=1 Tax=Gracilariopsis chorda TaxID=448386 RepID=A0A2V3IXR6_9FLOR|nr:Elongation factor P [Gracilariopsis chorda]|eukprot:PXF46936.1 Elongation factor P [Gracilariopsis chorda]